MHLLLTDAPVDDPAVTKVLVTFTRVDVYSEVAGAWQQVIDYGPRGRTFDLLTLRDGNTEELGAFQLPPGTYDQIRLELNADNQIEVAGELLPLAVPSGEQTGIKLVHPFTVTGVGATEITVDFDAGKSVKQVGHGWQVQPAIRIISTVTSDTATRVVGPAGATVRLLNEAQVEIPPGALSAETEISIRALRVDPATADKDIVPSSLVELGPSGTRFAVPVKVTVWYDPEELGDLPLAERAFASREAGHGWVMQPGTFDPKLGTCSGALSHFTTAGVGPIVRIIAPPPMFALDPGQSIYRVAALQDANGNDPHGIEVTWTPDDASRVSVSTDRGCTQSRYQSQSDCEAGPYCYWSTTGLFPQCINDTHYALATALRHPGTTTTVSTSGTKAPPGRDSISVYGLRVRFHDFYVQDDSDNVGAGEIYWQLLVNGEVVVDHMDWRSASTGDTVPLLDQTSRVFDTGAGETLHIRGFFGDDDGGANGGADEAYFDRDYGWGSIGHLENTNTDSNNGRGSLDIHVSSYLEKAL